ncbi:glycine betaine ABC transporter substrate-binding protein [Celeribacter persicus]|jgi:ABC-type proline/glycine betaine transport systems, periplasmic components|uniref:Glycine betaine/proline transport system substrate-binding protein n=1 Tax=Celeribacter persicus TaxID=1651082 RepID=A0A2T5H7H0_9RHOB|nr:glycine betaine ABC transporter substrate-binding protein [Celeribacter persicus]PTQ67510.1 glycine betaine/proline transport system substrate-binding protein [Celeribacter persicus]
MKNNKLFAAGFLALGTMAGGAFAADDCGDLKIAEFNWASGELMANVDAIILEEGFGCDVELINGGTNTLFASMNEKGEPQIAPELWTNAVREPLAKAVEEGRMIKLLDGPITGLGEGWWVTAAFAKDHPELDTVEKVLEHPEYFPYVEDDSKGAFMGCPSGWGCQPANANMFRAFGMDEKGWVLVDPGSAAGLEGAIAKASERDEYWFGYYWNPTAVVGKYKLVSLPFETEWAGSENWDGCMVKSVDECADPQPSSWTKSEVSTVVTKDVPEIAPEGVLDYLKARVFPGEVMNEMLVYMTDNQAIGEDAAYEFLEKHEDVWTKWVTPEVAEKVKGAL